MEKLEQSIRASGIPLKTTKEALKETDPRKWRGYLLGVWRWRQKSHPGLQELYDSKLIMVQYLLQPWVQAHPDERHPVTFDNWFTQPAFCRFLDKNLKLHYVGTLAETDKVNLKTGQMSLKDFADQLKKEHMETLQKNSKPATMPSEKRLPSRNPGSLSNPNALD